MKILLIRRIASLEDQRIFPIRIISLEKRNKKKKNLKMTDLDWSQEKIANLEKSIVFRKLSDREILNDIKPLFRLLDGDGKNTCKMDNYDPSLVNEISLQKEINEKFYDPEVMHTTLCIAQNTIRLSKNVNNNIHLFIHNLKRIGKKSVYGYALSASFKNADDFFILKSPQDYHDNLVIYQELAVGLYGTNALREFIPNFVYVYGGFDCSSPFIIGDNVINWCNLNEKENFQYVMYENVKDSVTFNDFIRNGCSENDFLNNYLQILLALNLAYDKINFTHYDLHSDNILIRKLPSKRSIKYNLNNRDVYVNGSTVATIIDYGMSRFEYKGVSYGSPSSYNMDNFFVSPRRSNLYHDAFKCLMFCAKTARSSNSLVFSMCSLIFYFFNKTDNLIDAVNVENYFNYFSYPFVNENKYSFSDLINFILKIKNLLTDKPLYPMFACENTCYNSKELLNKIKDSEVNNLNELIYQIEELNLKPRIENINFLLDEHYAMMKKNSEDIERNIFFILQNQKRNDKIFEKCVEWVSLNTNFVSYFTNLTNLKKFLSYIRVKSRILVDEFSSFLNDYERLHKKALTIKKIIVDDYNSIPYKKNPKENSVKLFLKKALNILG